MARLVRHRSFLVQCLRDTRAALGDQRQNYIKTVPCRAYIFDLAVTTRPTTSSTVYEQQEGLRIVVEQRGERTRLAGRTKLFSLTASVGLIGLAIAASYFWISGRSKQPTTRMPRSIAVLPFKPLVAESRDESLEIGMADSLITMLSNLGPGDRGQISPSGWATKTPTPRPGGPFNRSHNLLVRGSNPCGAPSKLVLFLHHAIIVGAGQQPATKG